MVKDIVVNLGAGAIDPAGAFAISVAETFQAHLAGIAFAYDPVIPGSVMGGISPEFIEQQRSETETTASDTIARFEQAAKRAGISYESRKLNASVAGAADQFAKLARRYDLAIVGQAGRGDESTTADLIDEAVLFQSGRPVIVVPFIQKAGLKLDHVMVCWDGSRTAARAVADAMPLMDKAKQIEVIIVASKSAKADETPGADLAEHLARHDLTVTLKRITAPDIDVASAILSYASDANTDMIVMGGYGHSRLREFVLGGVTSAILKSMTVPALMSH